MSKRFWEQKPGPSKKRRNSSPDHRTDVKLSRGTWSKSGSSREQVEPRKEGRKGTNRRDKSFETHQDRSGCNEFVASSSTKKQKAPFQHCHGNKEKHREARVKRDPSFERLLQMKNELMEEIARTDRDVTDRDKEEKEFILFRAKIIKKKMQEHKQRLRCCSVSPVRKTLDIQSQVSKDLESKDGPNSSSSESVESMKEFHTTGTSKTKMVTCSKQEEAVSSSQYEEDEIEKYIKKYKKKFDNDTSDDSYAVTKSKSRQKYDSSSEEEEAVLKFLKKKEIKREKEKKKRCKSKRTRVSSESSSTEDHEYIRKKKRSKRKRTQVSSESSSTEDQEHIRKKKIKQEKGRRKKEKNRARSVSSDSSLIEDQGDTHHKEPKRKKKKGRKEGKKPKKKKKLHIKEELHSSGESVTECDEPNMNIESYHEHENESTAVKRPEIESNASLDAIQRILNKQMVEVVELETDEDIYEIPINTQELRRQSEKLRPPGTSYEDRKSKDTEIVTLIDPENEVDTKEHCQMEELDVAPAKKQREIVYVNISLDKSNQKVAMIEVLTPSSKAPYRITKKSVEELADDFIKYLKRSSSGQGLVLVTPCLATFDHLFQAVALSPQHREALNTMFAGRTDLATVLNCSTSSDGIKGGWIRAAQLNSNRVKYLLTSFEPRVESEGCETEDMATLLPILLKGSEGSVEPHILPLFLPNQSYLAVLLHVSLLEVEVC